jgi:hypothetical protein
VERTARIARWILDLKYYWKYPPLYRTSGRRHHNSVHGTGTPPEEPDLLAERESQMLIERFKNRLAELAKHNAPVLPAEMNRGHFLTATDPVETRMGEALHRFPPDELYFLVMRFGLDSRDPKPPQYIASVLGVNLLKALDIGTAAECRLRNRKETSALLEAIAGQEVEGLARHLEVAATIDDGHRRRAANELWFYSRRPVRRLAMSTVMEGGFGAFAAAVRRGCRPQIRQNLGPC